VREACANLAKDGKELAKDLFNDIGARLPARDLQPKDLSDFTGSVGCKNATLSHHFE
jgi:hypothetical protein